MNKGGGGSGRGQAAQVQGAKRITTDDQQTPGFQGVETDEFPRE